MRPPLSLVPALPAAIGVISGIALSAASSAWLIGAIAMAGAILALALSRRYIAYTLLMTAIGAMLWLASQPPQLHSEYLDTSATIEGRVVTAEQKDYGYAIVIQVSRIGNHNACRARCYAQIRDFMPMAPQSGSTVRLYGRVTTIPDQPDVPGDAYYPGWLLRNGIRYRINYTAGTWIELQSASGLDRLANKMHDAMFNAIVRAPIDGPTASFLIATILGNDYFLSDDTLDAYRTSGTAHVLALSGMHVATLVMLSMLLLFPLSLIKRGRQYGQVALILLVWCYALATGLSPSVTRAATMLSVMALASIMQRASSPFNAVCIAAVTILAFSPHALFSPGFQLSFCAVISILIFNRALPASLCRRRIAYYFVSLIFLPVAAMTGTGLLSAYHFHIFPWSFIGGNIVMALVFPWLLGGGFALMLLTMAGINCLWLGKALDLTLSVANRCIDWFSTHMGAASVPDFSAWAFVPYVVAFVFMALALYRHGCDQPYRLSAGIAACSIVITIVTAGCIRRPATDAAYMLSGSNPMLLVCQQGSVAALPLSAKMPDKDFLESAQRRFNTTAKIYGEDRVAMIHPDYSHGQCSLLGGHILIGDKVLRIFDGSPVTRSSVRVNYAIISKASLCTIEQVVQACQPDTVVFTGDIVPSRRSRLKKECGDSVPCIDLHHRTLKIRF